MGPGPEEAPVNEIQTRFENLDAYSVCTAPAKKGKP